VGGASCGAEKGFRFLFIVQGFSFSFRFVFIFFLPFQNGPGVLLDTHVYMCVFWFYYLICYFVLDFSLLYFKVA